MFEADVASKALGIELVEAADGRAVTRMRITAEMVNGHDIAHGGYVFLLADTTFACACNSYGPVTVAVKVFNGRGYEATSMEDLSRRLGITKSAIYYHVPSKDELLRLAVDRALDGLFAVAEEATGIEGPAIDRLEFLVRGSIGVL